MTTRVPVRQAFRLGAVAAVTALVLLAPAAGAQTPESAATPAGADSPHPAHVHTGTCEELGEVVAPLTEVVDQAAVGEYRGASNSHAVKTSRTIIDLPLAEIIDGGHAINIHLSADEIDVYIACGNVGGVIEEEGGREHLLIALGEMNDSGHVGIAWLGSDGDQTEVQITLIEPEGME